MCRFPHVLPLILPGPLVPLVRSAGPLVPLVRWFRWSVGSAGPLGDRSGDDFAIGSKSCYTSPEKFDRHFGPPGRQIFTVRSGDNFAIDSKTCYTDPEKFDRHFGPPGRKIFTVRSGDNFAIDSKTCYTDPEKFDRHFGLPGRQIFTVRKESDREITSPLGQKLVIRTRKSLIDYPKRKTVENPIR
jgi:hypothetical protein